MGLINFHHIFGHWIGCAVDLMDVSAEGERFLGHKLTLSPKPGKIFNEECEPIENKPFGEDIHSYYSKVKCSDYGTEIERQFRDGLMEDANFDETIYPQSGMLSACSATDGWNDYVVGGVNLRGEFRSLVTKFNRTTGNQ